MAGVDLATSTLWLCALLALVVLPPLHRRPRAFVVVLALLNLGFVFALLAQRLSGGPMLLIVDAVAWVLTPLLLLWLGLRAVADARRGRVATAVLVGLAVFAVFVAHKRPDLGATHLGDLSPVLGVVGFSYVALRGIDLVVAVGQGRVPAPSPWQLVAYLMPFHMLGAGPVASAEGTLRTPSAAPPDRGQAMVAVERIASGLFKKYVLAQTLREVALTGFAADGAYFVVEVQLFTLWVYLDFSAYSDIAVGIGRLIGVPTPENFARPLTARNLIVFWERWHITLGAFARRNLFVPVQLHLVRRIRGRPQLAAAIALSLTFIAIGVWHGVTWGFVAWGAMHAAGVLSCNLYGAWLVRRLGRARARAFSQRRDVTAVATVLTFEFVAVSLMLVEVAWNG